MAFSRTWLAAPAGWLIDSVSWIKYLKLIGLDKVNKDTKKAANTFNQFDKNARSADRAGKGVANMSSNVTKNFSKMAQGITGGLVPAYATLAAQLFALDALVIAFEICFSL